jgi:hypothetical protein
MAFAHFAADGDVVFGWCHGGCGNKIHSVSVMMSERQQQY